MLAEAPYTQVRRAPDTSRDTIRPVSRAYYPKRDEKADAAYMAELNRLIAEQGPEESGRVLVRAGVPNCFFRLHQPNLKKLAERAGRRDGLADRHYCPHRNYATSEEWIAWYQGWRAGQAELRRRVAA